MPGRPALAMGRRRLPRSPPVPGRLRRPAQAQCDVLRAAGQRGLRRRQRRVDGRHRTRPRGAPSGAPRRRAAQRGAAGAPPRQQDVEHRCLPGQRAGRRRGRAERLQEPVRPSGAGSRAAPAALHRRRPVQSLLWCVVLVVPGHRERVSRELLARTGAALLAPWRRPRSRRTRPRPRGGVPAAAAAMPAKETRTTGLDPCGCGMGASASGSAAFVVIHRRFS